MYTVLTKLSLDAGDLKYNDALRTYQYGKYFLSCSFDCILYLVPIRVFNELTENVACEI